MAASAEQSTDSSHETPENMAVLRGQNPYLADEGVWARETGANDALVAGMLLLAMPDAPIISGDPRVAELVVLLLRHDATGSEGVMLNRPCFATLGDLLGWSEDRIEGSLWRAFQECHVYHGGMYAPNKVARQERLLLHGQADLPGAKEVAPGIFSDAAKHAALKVLSGTANIEEFRWFAGSLSWQPGQLKREIDEGIWRTAKCSRSVVLKQCWQLPVPLWREVHKLMGISVD